MIDQPDLQFDLVPGVRLATGAAGIRYRDRDDLVLVELAPGSVCAAVFTRNAFCAAPVTLARAHLGAGAPRWWLINAGNANAGTGARGLVDATASCQALAALTGDPAESCPALLHRCHRRAPAGGAHRRRPACPPGAPRSRPLARRRPGHHDHGHAAQARFPSVPGQRAHRHPHRDDQGRGHDLPGHGHHARLPGHRCGRRARHLGHLPAHRGRALIQRHHRRRGYLHQ